MQCEQCLNKIHENENFYTVKLVVRNFDWQPDPETGKMREAEVAFYLHRKCALDYFEEAG